MAHYSHTWSLTVESKAKLVGQALGSHYGKKEHMHNIVLSVILKVKLQLLEFTKEFKCPMIPSNVLLHVCCPM